MGEGTPRDYTDIQVDPIIETIELNGIGTFNFSAKELKRYTENAHFAEAVYEDLYHFLDPDIQISEEFLTQRSNEILESLTKQQRTVFQKVIDKIFELHRKAASADKSQIIDRFRRIKASVGTSTDTIADSDFSITPFGAIVIQVRDKKTWKQFVVHESTEGIAHGDVGFLIKMGFLAKEALTDDERDEAAYEIDRTVMVDAKSPRVKANKQHELFHDLYHQAIEQATESTYDVLPKNFIFDNRSKAAEFFLVMKNELIAYALARRWQTDFASIIGARTYEKICKELTANEAMLQEIIPDNYSIRIYIQKKIEEALEIGIATPEIEVARRKIVDDFMVTMALTRREIVRLALQESESFDEAIQVLLTAQDFKETFYRLSKIDPGKNIDAMSAIGANDTATTADELKIDNMVYNALYYKIPVKNLAQLIAVVTVYIEELESKESDDPSIAKKIITLKNTLNDFEEHKEEAVEK